ncbi:hypothetical protein V6Z11_A13G110200 [Gossypium hirsutum]
MFVVGSFVHWHTLALLATIPTLVQLLLLFFIPESPQWLPLRIFLCGQNLVVRKSLKPLCCASGEIKLIFLMKQLKQKIMSEGILDMFQKKHVQPLLTIAGVLVLMNLGGINALTYYSRAFFVSANIEGAAEDSISSSWKSQGLALLQVERYLMLHSMVIHLSRNLNFVLWKQGFVATLCTSFFNHDC